MTVSHRRVIAFVFFAGFFITAPILIFHASGYRYNSKKGLSIETIAAITIESQPKGARVFINDILYKDTTPARINDLYPNAYRLRIEKEGFTSWSGELSLHPGENKILRDIVLFPQKIPEEWQINGGGSGMVWSDAPSGWLMLENDASENNKKGSTYEGSEGMEREISLLNITKETSIVLGTFKSFTLGRIAPNAEKQEMAFTFEENGTTFLAVASYPIFGSGTIKKHALPLGYKVRMLHWQEGGGSIVVSNGSEVRSYEKDSFATKTVLTAPVTDVAINRKGDVTSIEETPQGSVLRFYKGDDITRVQYEWSLGNDGFTLPSLNDWEGVVAVYAASKQQVRWYRANPVSENAVFTMDQVESLVPIAHHRVMLLNSHEIKLWDGNVLLNTKISEVPPSQLVTRLSTPITSVVINNTATHVFFTTNEGLFVVETKFSAQPQWTKLYEGDDVRLVGINSDRFLVLEKEGKLFRYALK